MAERIAVHPQGRSLLTRVLRAVILLLLVGGVLAAATSWFSGRRAARESYDRLLLGAASDIAESIRIQNGEAMVDLPVSAFELLAQAPDDRVSYAVRGPDESLITGFDDAPRPPTERPRLTGPRFFDATMQGEKARFVEISRRFAERDFSGEVRVTVGQTLRARDAMTAQLMLEAVLPMGLAGIALLVASVLIIRSAMRPLEAIADGLATRDPYDLTPMPTENVPREVAVILEAMNRFMARLDRQFDAMRNLISDSAHQLRTPVAAIRVQAETALDAEDDACRDAALDRLVRRTRSLGTLLDQMLSRALVIHRNDSAPRQRLDLREVALDIVDSRDHEAIAPGIEVSLVIGEDAVEVLADAFSLTEAGRNLLSNALKHGAPPVRIGADRDGGEARLWVEDAGPGLPPELDGRLGERFQRSAASREDSAGIGLSIVTAVAEAFDGRIEARRGAEGFRISLVLPAAEPET
ncbi:sensor histidine kinase [uncultured Salipiger sp.]|uniref:sensor histidine kinase n=1 Tax=uncultured Salipiger sp. TaxID=499810 RepID=UPI00259385E2|nr:sensor histidine kinase [uncultured Salipiger sp.]